MAVGVVRLGRHDLHLKRTVSPPRAAQNQPVTVTIELRNEGRGAAPLLLLEDRLPPGLSGNARFAVHGIEATGRRRAGFVMKAVRRGRYDVGPLHLGFVDPFGLARVRWRALGVSSFLVHPRVERLSTPRDSGERRSVASTARRQPTGARGEDFYTMREYVEGDDLRKIHWPATAKRGAFMIRQEETPVAHSLDHPAGQRRGATAGSESLRASSARSRPPPRSVTSTCALATAGASPRPPEWAFHRAGATTISTDASNLLATIEAAPADKALLTRLIELEASGTR